MSTLDLSTRLMNLLRGHTYVSKMTGLPRTLMAHHIEALHRDLLPLLHEVSDEGYMRGEAAGWQTGYDSGRGNGD